MGRSATHKLLIRLSVVGAGLGPVLCFALGLSDIQIDSRLNQPLRARIEVLDVTDEEWSHIQARLTRQSAPDTPALQPTILESLTVRAIQDAQHRHFVEVRSTGPLSDPLFDLPVEIAAPAGRVIRNYPVLLDPPGPADDSPSSVAETRAPQMSSAGAPLVDGSAAGRAGANSTSHVRQRHGHRLNGIARPAGTRQAAMANTTSVRSAAAVTPSDPAQLELLKQLETLQQTLTQMQQTISAQNAQIADLTAKVVRAESQASRSAKAGSMAVSSSSAPSADVDTGDEDVAGDEVASPRPYFWLTLVLGATTFVAIVAAMLMKWRARHESAGRRPFQRTSTAAEDENDGSTRGKARSLTTPAAQQKQMEADGRVEISWDKELWNKPEWLRMFGEQPAVSAQQTAGAEQGPEAPQSAAARSAAPQSAVAQSTVPRFAAPPVAESQEVPANPGTTAQDPYSGTELGDLTETMAEQLFGEDTTQLAEAYAAAIREQAGEIRLGRDLAMTVERDEPGPLSETVNASETERLVEINPTELLESDPARLAQTAVMPETDRPQETRRTSERNQVAATGRMLETASLSETEAAQLLSADLNNLTNLTDVSAAAETEATALAEVDLTHLTDLANLAESEHVERANRPDEDTHVLDQHMMPDPPRLRRRRAGRR